MKVILIFKTVIMKNYIEIEYEGRESVYIGDILDELTDDLLIEEVEKREITDRILGLMKKPDSPFLDNHKDDNRRKMCELLELNYHSSKEDIINELKTKL